MTSLMILRLVCAAVVCAFTVVGVVLFARACLVIIARMRLGRPAPDRHERPWHRTVVMLGEVLGHTSFRGRPWIRVAHWLVMVSFPLLALTLVTGYGQVLAGPSFTLPWLDQQAWWSWVVEGIAWLSLAGIVGLSLVRRRLTAGGAARPPFDATSEAGTRTRSPRFSGSSAGQAVFVEAVVLIVVACVLVLRMLEVTHLRLTEPGSPLGSWSHYPLTVWAASALSRLGVAGVEAATVAVATVKVVVSMSWMVVIGLQPSMGVAWHRFLAVVNVWARRDTAKALGPAKELVFDNAQGQPTTLTAQTLDDLDAAMEAAEDQDREVTLGVGRIEDFTWKGLLDFSTCTECGRCQDLCPAWNTGKPLSPKLFTLALRDHHAAAAPFLQAAARLGVSSQEVTDEQAAAHGGILRGSRSRLAEGSAHTQDVLGTLLAAKAAPTDSGVATQPAPLAGEVIPAEVLWSCTTCGACVDQCPVDIEHVDHIIDLRRQQVLMESAFPKELGQMFRKMESKGNPWGLAPRKRMEWAKDLDFEVPVVGVDVEDASEVDYLFWVGCAGAYEDRAKRTTRAVAELLHTAGVSFAVLGDAESCTGDPARRAGNEILFQMLAGQNVETLNEVKAHRIVVTCAHCFNTLAREYPQAGGHYEVLHHTQLLSRLVREGRLRPVPAGAAAPPVDTEQAATSSAGTASAGPAGSGRSSLQPSGPGGRTSLALATPPPTVTVHDACYLGRHNQVYSPPRELVEATGAQTVEMPRSRERSFCCGGGGARAFMEESIGTRIAVERSREALGTGAQVIATACPFCTTMLSDGVASEGSDVRVTDVATLMLEAVRRGQDA
ncbi:(Fe-S)-binding protein [Actinomyces faecalis]|uniref:(Fe-S)-binding protein n=1 Tax=Actinomyces faecalis TaxID=2722820 RepID=UPI001552923D|nr:(Fe-S)-binding protein [Actinomyces faecalis]